jgi:hypothetical protein
MVSSLLTPIGLVLKTLRLLPGLLLAAALESPVSALGLIGAAIAAHFGSSSVVGGVEFMYVAWHGSHLGLPSMADHRNRHTDRRDTLYSASDISRSSRVSSLLVICSFFLAGSVGLIQNSGSVTGIATA